MNLFLFAKKLGLILILLVTVFSFCTGQSILVDDFNRADNNAVGNGWTEIETAATGARIVSNRLQLGSTTAGREFVWQDLSSFASPIITNGITTNTALLTWAFNFRTSNGNTSGFDASNYGMAFVLAKTATATNAGNGYAVVIGQSGTTDAIRLVSFAGGGDLNSEYTNIISANDYGTEYISVRVTYDPTNDQWSLYVESNASAFPQADPRNTATQIGSSTVNTTYTAAGNDLRYFGAYWNHSTGATDNAIFDDIYAPVTTVICTPTATVSNFSPSQGPTGTIVTITGTGLNTVTQVLFGGIAATSFTIVNTTTITAEVAATAITGKITLVDGASCSSQSTGDFTVLSQNANCGIGATGTDLIISEIFDSQVGSIGYIEIFNPTSGSINLNGYYLRINTGAITNLANFASFSLASGAVAVIRIGDPSVSGSSLCPSATLTETFNGASGFNASDEIALMKGTSGSGTVLDVVNTPAAVGYSQLRNAGAITPRTTFQSGEWTNADPETCGHLGTAPAALTTTNVTITTQPADVNCTAVTFSVTASAIPGTINYTWYYQLPGSASWALVSALNGTNGLTVAGSGTSSITITGNTAILKDYQFYCEIGSGGSPQCIKYTNAVQYTYTSQPYYRTVASGQWTNPAIWQMSTTEGGSYIAACQYPVATNSDKVNILITHTVTLDVIDVNIDWVNINTGGALTIGTNSLLSFNNGNSGGADFEVNGTLTDGGSTSNGVDFITSSGAAWILGANATIIRTNTSSASTYRDNYQNGMSNIPSTANWILRGSSALNVPFTTVATSAANQSFPSSTFYPNLTIESTGGNWNPAFGSGSRFTGSSDFATVKGNLDIGGTGLGTVTMYNENTNATSLQILGNLTVRASSTLTNNGNTSGTGFEVKGNVAVGGVLTVNGSGSTGLLTLSGSAAQTVSGAGTITLQNLTINNSSSGIGSGVTLNRTLSMPGNLTLTDGTLNTTSTNLFTMTAGSTNTGGGSFASFVNGPMKKIGNAAFTFPVGKLVSGTEYHFRPILISAPAVITEEFTAEFQRANPITQGNINPDALTDGLSHISRCEYWDLVRNVGLTDVNVTLSWSNNPLGRSICNVADPATFPYVDNLPNLVVVPFESSLWGDQAAARYGQTSTSGSTSPASPFLGYITWNGLGNIGAYQKFSLGTTDFNFNPLPFNLSLFKATGKQKQVDIDWTVSNNHQILQYTIERSKDGLVFEPIQTIAAKAIISLASYKEIDATPFNGWNYYRLRAKDLDGKTTVSFTEKVWMGNRSIITISPVPAKDVLSIYIPNPENITGIELLNPIGQRLKNIQGIRTLQQLTISELTPGIYYLRFTGKNGVKVKTFVKQ